MKVVSLRRRKLEKLQLEARRWPHPLPVLSDESSHEDALVYARHDAGLCRLDVGDALTHEDTVAILALQIEAKRPELEARAAELASDLERFVKTGVSELYPELNGGE